jgi:hypothetical protein
MVATGHFPPECGLKFFPIMDLAEEKGLLEQFQGDAIGYIEVSSW